MMLTEQMSMLYPVVAILLLLTVFVLYVYYTSDRLYRIKLLLGPALLAACVFIVPWIGARLGYAWPAPVPASFRYLAHRTVVVDGQKRWMDVFLVSRRPLDAQARLLRIRWTRQMEDVLDEAERMKEGPGGGEIIVNGPTAGSGGFGGDAGHSAIRVLPQDQVQKHAPPARNHATGGPEAEPPRRQAGPFEFPV